MGNIFSQIVNHWYRVCACACAYVCVCVCNGLRWFLETIKPIFVVNENAFEVNYGVEIPSQRMDAMNRRRCRRRRRCCCCCCRLCTSGAHNNNKHTNYKIQHTRSKPYSLIAWTDRVFQNHKNRLILLHMCIL